jgi:glucan phosphoethanolaminetransferase (alkaline phosphatase superfamily)
MVDSTHQPIGSRSSSRSERGSWLRTRPLHGPLFVLLGETIISTAFIFYFCRSFKISKSLIAIHLPLAIGFFSLSMVVPGLLLFGWPARRRKSLKYFLALIPGLAFSGLAILYTADFASYMWTGSNINYELVHRFLYDWRHGRALVPLSGWIYVSVIVFVVIVLAIFLRLARVIFSGVENVSLAGAHHSFFMHRRRAIKSGVVIGLIVLGYAGYLYATLRRAPYSELLSSDPILSFLRSTTEVYDPNYPAFVSKLRAEEQRCRSSYPQAQTFEKKNVILIVVDALRADHTQVYGYNRATTPFLQSLVDAGHLRKVEFATSTCAETYCGVMSTLASKSRRRQVAGDFKLYDLLHDQGYKTYFILSGIHDWQGLRDAYGREMALYFDGSNSKRYSSEDDRLIFEGFEQVPNYTGAPVFFLVHLMSTHTMGERQEAYNLFQPLPGPKDWQALFHGENDRRSLIINNYDDGVLQADDMIKGVFATLHQKGYLQDSMVVILADHGEGLGDHGKSGYGHITSLYQEFIRIPLLIYDESAFKYANLKFATQIDVAPTIVDRLRLPIPGCWQGASLLNPNIKTVTTHQTMLSKPCYAVLYRTDAAMYKYIYCSVGKKEELYNLTDDPNEQSDLIGTVDPLLLQFMRAELQRMKSD